MPYKTTRELPSAVKALPPHAQSIFMAAFNSAAKQYDSEDRQFSVAWAAVKRLYSKGKDGKWHRIKEATALTEAATKTEGGKEFPAAAFALVPDASMPSSWKMRLWEEPGGGPTAAQVGRAIAALGKGFRGHKVSIPRDAMASVKAKIRAAWRKTHGEGDEMPAVLKEAEGDLDDEAQNWLDDQMASILIAADLSDGSEPLIEQMMADEDPRERYHDECLRDAIYSAMNLLSRRELELSGDERDALTGMVSRLVQKLGVDHEQMAESCPADCLNLDAVQDAAESLKVESDLQEAGQRHRNEDYPVFDQILDLVKRLRGQSPQELKAEQARATQEQVEADPTEQMKSGYHDGLKESADLALRESDLEILHEASTDGSGREWQVRIIQAGLSKNGRTYPLQVLQQAAPLFEGVKVYTYDRLLKGREVYDHLSEEEVRANPQGYAKDLVGYLKEPRMVGSSLLGTLVLFKSGQWLGENLRDAVARGLPLPYGLSIDASGAAHDVLQGGQPVAQVDAIHEVRSVDVVTHPAAGGGFLRLVASYHAAAAGADEAALVALVESLQAQMTRLQVELQIREAFDECAIGASDRRALLPKLLAILGSS